MWALLRLPRLSLPVLWFGTDFMGAASKEVTALQARQQCLATFEKSEAETAALLEAEVDEAIATCGGDVRAALRASSRFSSLNAEVSRSHWGLFNSMSVVGMLSE